MPARKPTISDRFYTILQKLFREIDQKAIEAEVKALRETKPRASRRELAAYLTRKAAAKTAAIGAAAASVPGPAALLAMGPDIFNLVRQQSRLVLSIAFLYGQKPNLRERFREVLATLAIASGASATKKATQYVVMRQLARRMAGRYVSRRASTVFAPAIGFLVGGTINYLSVRAVGMAAQKYYSARSRRKAPGRKKRRVSAAARSSRPSSRRTRAPAR